MTDRLKSFDESKIDRADDGKFGHGSGHSNHLPENAGKNPSRKVPRRGKPKRTPRQERRIAARREAAREAMAADTARNANAVVDPISQELADSGLDEPVRSLQSLALRLSSVGSVRGATEAITEAASELKTQAATHKRRVKEAVRGAVAGLPPKAAREISEAITAQLDDAGLGARFEEAARELKSAKKEAATGGHRSELVGAVMEAMRDMADVGGYHADVQEALMDRSDEDIDDMISSGHGGFAPEADDDGEPVEDAGPYRDAYRSAMRKAAESLIGARFADTGAGRERQANTAELAWRLKNGDRIRALPTHAHVRASEGVLKNARAEEKKAAGTYLHPGLAARAQRLQDYHDRARSAHEAAVARLRAGDGGIQ